MFGCSLLFPADLAIVTSVPVNARGMTQDRSRQTLTLQATSQGDRAARFEPRAEAVRASDAGKQQGTRRLRLTSERNYKALEPSSQRGEPSNTSSVDSSEMSRRQAQEGHHGYSTDIDRRDDHRRQPKAIWELDASVNQALTAQFRSQFPPVRSPSDTG